MKLVAPVDTICDPVWPNVGVEYWYLRTLQLPLSMMTHEIQQLLSSDWAHGVNLGAFGADAPALSTLVQRTMDAWAKRWVNRWDEMAAQIAQQFATQSKHATDAMIMSSFRKAGFTVRFRATAAMKDAYKVRVQANIELIRSIPQEYLKSVRTAVWDTVTKGGDVAKMTAAIQEVYGVGLRRAAFIALDQNNKAKAVFEEARRTEVGIAEAIWQHSTAGQEKYKRVTHVEASQQRIRYNIKDGWFDPAIQRWIWPGTEIGCRCTSRAIIPGLTRSKYYAEA